jgi:hypothetical protein
MGELFENVCDAEGTSSFFEFGGAGLPLNGVPVRKNQGDKWHLTFGGELFIICMVEVNRRSGQGEG